MFWGVDWFSYSYNYYLGGECPTNDLSDLENNYITVILISIPSHPTRKTLTISHKSTHSSLLFLNGAAVVISFLISKLILATCIFWNFRALDLPVWYK